ncbi:hypothetical protein CPB85DRAFT_1256035 [Mucidula mucida]|nr:hypothetical protein CPB85DRAFT_1256035 [Mucidula mucida]
MALKRPYSDEWHDFSEDTMNWTCDTTVISRTDLEEAHNSRYQFKKRLCNAERGMQPTSVTRASLRPGPPSVKTIVSWINWPSPSFVDPSSTFYALLYPSIVILRLLARPPSNPAQVQGVLLEDNIGRDRFTVDIAKFKTLDKSARSSMTTIDDENSTLTLVESSHLIGVI